MECVDGYLANNKCKSCPSGCLKCTENECTSCSSGYNLKLNYEGKQVCRPACKFPCVNCTETSCTNCEYGYSLSGGSCTLSLNCSTLTCTFCPVGSYNSGSDSFVCAKCLSNCATCTSASTCTSCMDGFYLDSGTTTSCKACNSRCLTCKDSTSCMLCAPGYVKQIESMVNILDLESAVVNDNFCIPCDSNCKTCSVRPERCTSCNSDMRLFGTRCAGIYTVGYNYHLVMPYTDFMANAFSGDFISKLSTNIGVNAADNYINYINKGSTIIGGQVSASDANNAQSISNSLLDSSVPGFTGSVSTQIYYGDDPFFNIPTKKQTVNKVGLIVGVTIGSVAFVVIVGVVIYVLVRRHKMSQMQTVDGFTKTDFEATKNGPSVNELVMKK